MAQSADVIVVGLGAMGSAAATHLAQRGRRVAGFDRFRPPHASGSSHGQTRIIREAYFEHPAYVPLVRRAYELWGALQDGAAQPLLRITGGLMIGPAGGVVVTGSRRSAETHQLPHEMIPAADVCRRFPALRPSADMVAVWEPRAGILFPERCVAAHLAAARAAGAQLCFDEEVVGWGPDGSGVRVTTARGEWRAGRLILAAGPWMGRLVPAWAGRFVIERQVQYWFGRAAGPDGDRFGPDECPVHLWEHEPGRYFYGFPDLGEGVKLAGHHEGVAVDPDRVVREVSADEVAGLRALQRRFVPGASGPLRATAVCLYTNTPDGHFLLDEAPGSGGRVLVASPCSGHGFKFASAIGEVAADWADGVTPRFELDLFRAGGRMAPA